MSRIKGHWMRVDFNARYSRCLYCGKVVRNWWAKPIIHKGGKP